MLKKVVLTGQLILKKKSYISKLLTKTNSIEKWIPNHKQ